MEKHDAYQLSASVNDGLLEVIKLERQEKAGALLCDVRALKGPNDIISAYFRVRSIPQDIQMLPAAIVSSSENKEYQAFHETTAANAGQSVKYFTDPDAARAWLKSRLARRNRA